MTKKEAQEELDHLRQDKTFVPTRKRTQSSSFSRNDPRPTFISKGA